MNLSKNHIFILLCFIAALIQCSTSAHGLSLEEAVDMASTHNPGLQEKRLDRSILKME